MSKNTIFILFCKKGCYVGLYDIYEQAVRALNKELSKDNGFCSYIV